MAYNITVIPGDGIGPEVIEATLRCIDALGLKINWEFVLAGEPALKKEGNLLPPKTIESIKKNRVAIKGPIVTPVGSGFRSVNVAIRHSLDLFACVRPSWYIEGIPSARRGTDLIVVRENSEDLYAGIEFEAHTEEAQQIIDFVKQATGKEIRKDSAISIKPISSFASRRVIKFSFELARKERRKKVTCVHKANIMKATDGLFLETFREVAKGYPDIVAEDIIVDNLSMQLVLRPHKFDILVLPNLYGDIISDLCAGLIGGLGVAPGANIGDDCAVFEPVHGAAPKYKGKNKVNPVATILSGVMMLKHLGEHKAASLLKEATCKVIEEGKFVTYDLKPNRDDPSAVGTKEMASAIIEKIQELKN